MNVLVFGANGTLGGAIVDLMKATGSQVVTASRDSSKTDVQMKNIVEQLKKIDRKFDSCIWAQGMNTSDTLTNSEDFQKVFDANVSSFASSGTLLKDLIIESGLFEGWSVEQVLMEANKALGGMSNYAYTELTSIIDKISSNVLIFILFTYFICLYSLIICSISLNLVISLSLVSIIKSRV